MFLLWLRRLYRIRKFGLLHHRRRPGIKQRLARKQLITHGSVVHKDSLNYSGLLQIVWQQRLIYVHVRVVRPRVVIERILYKLKTRNADGIKRKVIGSVLIL